MEYCIEMIKILGLDPSLLQTGWGIIDLLDNVDETKIIHYADGVIKSKQTSPIEKRLFNLHAKIEEIIMQHKPDVVCIESTYCGINPITTLRLGCAYGTILATVAKCGIAVIQYPTRCIKHAVTGKGSNTKQDVRASVEQILSIQTANFDISDALATAITYALDQIKNKQ